MTYLDKNGLQAVTNKLVQGEAIKVVSSKGHNVKDVIDNIKDDCNDIKNPFSYKIENRVSNFRVGKGKDINITREIKEYNTELEFKGKTYQNLTSRGMSFKVQNFEGIFVQEDGPDSLLVTRISDNNQGWLYACNMKLKRALIKPSTKYTLIFKLDANKEITMPVSLRNGNAVNPITDQVNAVNVYSNIYVATLTTVSDFTDLGIHQVIYFHGYYPRATGDWCRYYHDVIFLEGDYSNTPIEEFPKYFEGIKSSFEEGVVDVKVKSKNLFDTTKLITSSNSNVSIVALKDKFLLHGYIDNSWASFATSNSLPPGTYSFQVYNKGIPWGGKGKIWGYNSEGELILNVGGETTFTLKEEVKDIKFVIQYFNAENLVDCEITIQIEEGTKITPYEPYYENHISFDIGAPLMSLPNGTCDEIRNNNGQWELIRKIGKVVLNGSEDWNLGLGSSGWNVNGNTLPFYAYLIDDKKVNGHSLTDLFTTSTGSIIVGIDEESFSLGHSNYITIRLKKDKLLTEDANGFKQWLSQNPTTVYYEKGVPEIIPIEPVKAYIKTGATIAINSEIVPTSYHKVTLNRGEQIEQAIVEIAALKAKIDTLETAYNSYLLETQHKLSLLGFEYQLESEEI